MILVERLLGSFWALFLHRTTFVDVYYYRFGAEPALELGDLIIDGLSINLRGELPSWEECNIYGLAMLIDGASAGPTTELYLAPFLDFLSDRTLVRHGTILLVLSVLVQTIR